MVRNVDYESRRKAVLAATINKYIKEAIPVSSEDMAREFDLSSATIRNVFADLEEGGYLTHPYTSGGRMPTKKGYRYYVDFLVSQMELLDEEKESILNEYRQEIKLLDEALDRTSEIISLVTHYAGIVSFLEWDDKLFYKGISQILNHPEFQDFTKIRIFFKFIEDRRQLLSIVNRDFHDRVKVYIGEELDCPEMQGCSLVVSRYRIRNKPLGRIAVLGPMRMEYNHIIPALEYISEALSDFLSGI